MAGPPPFTAADLRAGPSGPLVPPTPPTPEPPPGPPGRAGIWWRLDGTGDAITWAEVMAIVDVTPSPLTIWVSEIGPYSIPAVVSDLHGSNFEAPAYSDIRPSVVVADGAELQNCAGQVGPVVLTANPSASPTFTYPASTAPTYLLAGHYCSIANAGTAPLFSVAGGIEFRIIAREFAALGAGVVDVIEGSQLFLIAEDEPILSADWAQSSDASGVLVYGHDGSLTFPIVTTGMSLVQNSPLGQCGGGGPTASRPTPVPGTKQGLMYFDTSLSPPRPIWWDGSAWTNSFGSAGQFVLGASDGWINMSGGAFNTAQVETPVQQNNYFVADFLQSVKSLFAWQFPMPGDWDGGSVTARFYWLANSASTNAVVWGAQGVALESGDPLDSPQGAAQEVTSANTGTNAANVSAPTAALTLGGSPSPGADVLFQVYRLGSGADTLAATARLQFVLITYSRAP